MKKLMNFKSVKGNKNNLQLILTIFVAFLISFLCILNGQMGTDEGIWTYAGRVWVENDIKPYLGFVDDKPPGVIEVYALANLLSGVNYIVPRLFGILATLLIGYFIYKITSYIKDSKAGLIALIVFVFSMFWQNINGPHIAYSETFMILFTSMGYFFSLNKSHSSLNIFFVGTLMGVALSFKQVALFTVPPLIFIFATTKNKVNTWNILTISLKMVPGIMLSSFLIHVIALDSNNFFIYLKYAWLNPTVNDSFWRRIPLFFDTFYNSRLVLFYPFILFNFLIYFTHKKGSLLVTYLWLWFLFGFIGVNISGNYYGHHITQMLPPLAILVGVSTKQLLDHFSLFFYKVIILIGIIFMSLSLIIDNISSMFFSKKQINIAAINHIKRISKHKKIGFWLKNNSNLCDKIYFLNNYSTPILSYSERIVASKFTGTSLLKDKTRLKNVITNLKNTRPKFILKYKGRKEYNKKLLKFLKQNYYFKIDKFGWQIYQYNNPSSPITESS